jgi:hypothetical protein
VAYGLDDSWDNCTRVARAGNACFGLYVRCGIWSARNLTDGFVPGEIAAGYGSPEQTRKLVDVGLWETVEGGYRMPDYLERNPSAEKVRARRDADSDRKARWRERRPSARSHGGTPRGTEDRTPRSPTTPKGVGALRAVPDWCGRCHRDTRMAVDEADRSVPCPECSPRRTA